MESYGQIEEILGKIKTRVMSAPCPKCGGLPENPPKPDEKVKCPFCRTYYTIENSLEEETTSALRNIVLGSVSEVTGHIDAVTTKKFDGLFALLKEYAEQAFADSGELFKALGRMPSSHELDEQLVKQSQAVLCTIRESSRRLLNGQDVIAGKVDSAVERLSSLKMSMAELQEQISRIERQNHRTGNIMLCYVDADGQQREIGGESITLGRNAKTSELEARYPDGRIMGLGLCDPTVSREHFRFMTIDGGHRLQDLGSRNGTRLNGRKIEPGTLHQVRDGDEIGVGANFRLTLRFLRS